MDPESGKSVANKESGIQRVPMLRMSPGHADNLYGNETVRNLLTVGGVKFPKPNEQGHITSAVDVPVNVINNFVTMNEKRTLGAPEFWMVQHAVQSEVLNSSLPDLLLRAYDKLLNVVETQGNGTEAQRAMVQETARKAAEVRMKYGVIASLHKRLLPPEYQLPDIIELDESISGYDARAIALGIPVEQEEEA